MPSGNPRILHPLESGHMVPVDDDAIATALVEVEVALMRAWADVVPEALAAAREASEIFGWPLTHHDRTGMSANVVAHTTATTGTPVVAVVEAMRTRLGPEAALWLHRGATSQDILDTALMRVSGDAGHAIALALDDTAATLWRVGHDHATTATAARTLTQHAVPTTVGARAANRARAMERAATRVRDALAVAPAQLAGAGGTSAAFLEVARMSGADHPGAAVALLKQRFAGYLDLQAPAAPWHTARWPITELGDALVQAVDAIGGWASDLVTTSRTEIAETSDSAGRVLDVAPQVQPHLGGASALGGHPRATLGATLHAAAALAGDERPDGAWHAEWPALQDLLRLAWSASRTAADLAPRITVDTDRTAHHLDRTGPRIVSERLALRLTPVLGRDRVAQLLTSITDTETLRRTLASEAALGGIDLDNLLDPHRYLGDAPRLARGMTEEP